MNDFAEINRMYSLMNPLFANQVSKGLFRYAARYPDHNVVIFEGWRSPARQTSLYAQGREDPGKIVTNAEPWESWHQYGLAADCARYNAKLKRWSWDFDGDHLRECMIACQLEPGPAQDFGHCELTGGLTLKEAKQYQERVGILGLWAEISRRGVIK